MERYAHHQLCMFSCLFNCQANYLWAYISNGQFHDPPCIVVDLENSVNHRNDSPCIVVDLESLTFDRSMVPSLTRKTSPSEYETAPSECFSLPTNQIANSCALCSTSDDQPDEHSLSVLSAARTLYEISSQNLPEKQKKSSEKKLSKIYKSKAKNREFGYHQFAQPKSIAGSDSISNVDAMVRSKKLKLSIDVRNNITNGAYTSKKIPQTHLLYDLLDLLQLQASPQLLK